MRTAKLAGVIGALLAADAGCGAAWAQPPDGLDRLAGRWRCAGRFIANDKPIASTISIHRDAASGAMVVRHDDDAPGVYHALEVWSFGKSAGFRAAIADAYTGMRWFSSSGWRGDSLTWSRPADGAPAEQFAYALQADGTLRVDWLTARKDGALALGDTLSCRRRP